jgi:erythromycin esterase-like protein
LRSANDLDPLLDRIGESRYVLLGEASHGTHEYYTWRAVISRRLIEEKGVSFIAVEGDWPDCYRVNRYVKGYPDSGQAPGGAREVLHAFARWPTWMWANAEVVDLAKWLREHNTHIGDARFTDMPKGMVNVGQLVREGYAEEGVVLIGFGSYRGSVIAGREWEAPMERMRVPPGRPGSWEDVLHRSGVEDCLLLLGEARRNESFQEERGHRAIGVVYHPEYERLGNYVPTMLPFRYDAFLYLEETQALQPLLEVKPVEQTEMPETYPSGV